MPVIAGAARPAVTPEQVTRALREVFDPELGMSIVELGLVYGIDVRGGAVTVTMTLTAPGLSHPRRDVGVGEGNGHEGSGRGAGRRDDHVRSALDS